MTRLPIIACMLILAACTPAEPPDSMPPVGAGPSFVGTETCVTCHADQGALWRGSHHDLAMQDATSDTVLGDFARGRIQLGDLVAELSDDGTFQIGDVSAQGEIETLTVRYVFGIQPLQQYLVESARGRYQVYPLAWDTRTAESGGQRWFRPYADDVVSEHDLLHWASRLQTWNTMCADCHSTNLRKNYSLESDSFETQWSSLDVGCEACHGAGSAHAANPSSHELALRSVDRQWVHRDDSGIAARMPATPDRTELETCGRCHARREQLGEDFEPGERLLDAYRPMLLEEALYHDDGQVLDEVYVFGSFLQSAMHAAGVTCSDCHDPHSATVYSTGNSLCARCHEPARFDSVEHHHHATDGAGAECISCHMPSRTYMAIDERRDHSFRVPRPDLSERLGVPNACTQCHDGQTSAWAADTVAAWFPEGRSGTRHYGEALHAARNWSVDRSIELRTLVRDDSLPPIVRATALSLMGTQIDNEMLDVIRQSLTDSEPLVLLGALDALGATPANIRLSFAEHLLTHPLRAVRSDAARLLAPARAELDDARRTALETALAEYRASQRLNADRAEGLYNLGRLNVDLGEYDAAAEAFRTAIAREPAFVPAYVNLADLYSRSGDEEAAGRVLRDAAAVRPENPTVLLALGLSLVRQGRQTEALELIEMAASSAADNPYYEYVWGVALNSVGDSDRAFEVLQEANLRFPGYREIIVALATMSRDIGRRQEALDYARRLFALSATDPTARALLENLGEAPP